MFRLNWLSRVKWMKWNKLPLFRSYIIILQSTFVLHLAVKTFTEAQMCVLLWKIEIELKLKYSIFTYHILKLYFLKHLNEGKVFMSTFSRAFSSIDCFQDFFFFWICQFFPHKLRTLTPCVHIEEENFCPRRKVEQQGNSSFLHPTVF